MKGRKGMEAWGKEGEQARDRERVNEKKPEGEVRGVTLFCFLASPRGLHISSEMPK